MPMLGVSPETGSPQEKAVALSFTPPIPIPRGTQRVDPSPPPKQVPIPRSSSNLSQGPPPSEEVRGMTEGPDYGCGCDLAEGSTLRTPRQVSLSTRWKPCGRTADYSLK
jgi:hypothetical protein